MKTKTIGDIDNPNRRMIYAFVSWKVLRAKQPVIHCVPAGIHALFIVFLLSFLYSSYANSAELPEKSSAVNKQRTQAERTGTEKNPLIIKILPTSSDSTQSGAKHGEEKESQETRIANATWGLFWVTFALAAFTALLWLANLRLVKDSTKSAKAARDSADAATANARTLIDSERAYIFAEIQLQLFSDSAMDAEFGAVRLLQFFGITVKLPP